MPLMQDVTPAELKQFMEKWKLSVTDIVADTKIHSNTIYNFLRGNSVTPRTRAVLARWKNERETARPEAAVVS
jgi:plasmid maintenance system antidote protein VapI